VQKMRNTEVSHNTLSFLRRGQYQHAQMPEVGTCASPVADDMLRKCAKAFRCAKPNATDFLAACAQHGKRESSG
jgi:hypothetical protein